MRFVLAFALAAQLVACSSGSLLGSSADGLTDDSASIQAGDTLRVAVATLNLRRGPTTEDTILAVLESGALLTALDPPTGDGWIAVRDASQRAGFVYGDYVEKVSAPSSAGTLMSEPGPASGATCDPSRASGAVPQMHKAFHDTIAFAEGTRGYSKDGYDVMFSHKTFSSCATHPNQCLDFGSTCSTAAGRYQFLTTTWNNAARAEGLDSFEPENQERGAAYLIKTVRRVQLPQDRALTASEFQNALSKLSYEWASLPPARYGQGVKTVAQLREVYCEAAGCQ